MPQTQPTVCAIMLVNGREEMVRRAVKCFREQTYKPTTLIILDSGRVPFPIKSIYRWHTIQYCHRPRLEGVSIGELRNEAAWMVHQDYPCIVHFDSDDWSHPNRIAEQVALLQSSGKQCVGYRDMLFWETPMEHAAPEFHRTWLYTNNDPRYCLGTSLCYWREAWERRPFPDLPKKKGGPAEDVEWLREVDSLGVSSIAPTIADSGNPKFPGLTRTDEPRMIASIHGNNTQYYNPAEYVARQMGTSWKRVAEWDAHCCERMAL